MAAILLPQRWAQQPKGWIEVNWAHPLAPKRGFVVVCQSGGNLPVRLAPGQAPLLIPSTQTVARMSAAGLGFGCTSETTSSPSGVVSPVLSADPADGTTILFVGALTAAPTVGQRIFDCSSSLAAVDSAAGRWQYNVDTSTNGSTFVTPAASTSFYAGQRVCFTHDGVSSTAGADAFINGARVGASYVSGGGTMTSTAGKTYRIANNSAGTRGFTGSLPLIYWDTYWRKPDEAAALSENPWQIFKPINRRIWVPSAAGGTTNATIAGTDGADTTAVAASTWTTAQIVGADGADVSSIAATVTTGAAITGTDGADNAVIAAANWATAQIAATDGTDLSSVLADVGGTTLATITATDGADAASIYAANWTTATLAAIDGADAAAVAGRITTGAAIAGTDGADSAAIIAGGVGTTTAGISATDGADIAALTATGPIVLGIGRAMRQHSIRSNIQRSSR